jgi:hypothetical protein
VKRALSFVVSTAFLFSCPAFGATLESVKGKVLINRGDGFQSASSGMQANAGDRLMADPGGSAQLVYSEECQVKVVPGKLVSVGKQPPCTAPYLAGLEYVPPEPNYGLWPFIGAAAVGWGIFCAATYCHDHGASP